MPKMLLTDEEKRHIEQRRDNEKRFNLGYNQCVVDVISYLQQYGPDDLNAMYKWLNESRKTIRP